ncbi:MAG: arginine repressor [Ruminococcaceae bacterium]|nr:arginine repressor [Oscillospiraceae bacterium]
MKKNRLDKIIEIITQNEVETQDELISYLKDAGYAVTQATVSRDIRELKLAKVMTGRGSYRYVLPKEDKDTRRIHITHALAETITRVEVAQNIIVLHTYAGMAQAVALEVDRLSHPDILGCVAGDDTIIIVARDNTVATALSEQMQEMIRSRMRPARENK